MTEHTNRPLDGSDTPSDIPPIQSDPISFPSPSPTPTPLVRSQSPSPSLSAVAAHNTTLATPQPNDQRDRETVNDPGVVSLRGMFPDYDDLILMSVLQSVNGNQDRAIDALLGMSDPDYRSEAPIPVAEIPVPTFSQEELDEQFARQLALQDQQQQTEQWIQVHGVDHPPPAVYQSSRPNARQAWTPQPAQGQDRPGEFQEQFNKFAETGKKTIGSIFSKVKAKIQEFETGRPAGQASGSQQQGWTSSPSGGFAPSPPQSQQQQPSYYEPGPRRTARTSSPPVQGYDVSATVPSSSPPSQTTTSQLQPEPSPQPVAVPPPQAGLALDGGKLGLLPKRPVTLLRDPAAPTSATTGSSAASATHDYHDDSDNEDDGLEYAENPFESDHVPPKTK